MRTRRGALLVAASVATLIAAGCSGAANGGTGDNNGVPTGGTPVAGGTAVFALQPSTTPNWIWPFIDPGHSTGANVLQFQPLMYRPLYVFGDGQATTINNNKSLANPPRYSNGGRTVTITLKPYKWSDGTSVTSTDVMFWLNMARSQKDKWAWYSPGRIPANITSATIDGPTTITLNLDRPYSQQWYTTNQLTTITPMPRAWDRTANGPSNCAGNVSDCPAVYAYLYSQAKDLKSYASSELWSVVDGPWKLSSFDADGHVAMVPNKLYSGPDKPRLEKFQMAPFTTDSAEYNVLRAGGSSIHVGYIPAQDITAPTNDPTVAGPNPLAANYYMVPWIQYRINFFEWNFNNPTVGPIFRQLYFRQAFQHLVNQDAIIKGPMKGYGYPTTGPVPLLPKSSYVSSRGQAVPYPYSIDKAKALLEQHGWTINTSGPGTCTRPGTGPGQCGAGISAGQRLEFNLVYVSGSSVVAQAMEALKSDESKAGIVLNLSGGTFNDVIGSLIPCKPDENVCKWQFLNWGTGYSVTGYPTGDQIFATGAGGNKNRYSDQVNDANIARTIQSSDLSTLHQYQDYLADQLPVVWQPNQVAQLTAVATNLRGVAPQNVAGRIFPEDWYFVSK
ncbi:ABC transporter substrate-binding protein [Amycolatopsis jejuensis]|uniref:ABC transporter substrate-binding protein n=1 Tax=Amycolatopsis jejuensis TaxID=330084 RepID=UPI000AD70A4E|nr:ABC transporter substrate-binding protein [Amycolatopsis jejuensis]